MMLRTSTAFDPTAVAADFRLVADGRVSPILMWEKHPAAIIALLLVIGIFLLLLRRLLFPRRHGRVPA
jgi:hypothetical protein